MKGNKGEWSEVYVFLKLLAEGKLYAADANLNRLSDIFYPIIKILREEASDGKKREYVLNGDISIVDGATGKTLAKFPVKDFMSAAGILLDNLKKAKGPSFEVKDAESFLKQIDCSSLTPAKSNKSDIKIVVHDIRTGIKPTLGFSIKSMLGQKSTLFNPGEGTNFIYAVDGASAGKIDLEKTNSISAEPKITKRIEYLTENGCTLTYRDIQSDTFKRNLVIIDSKMPDILAYLLLYKYTEKAGSDLKNLLEIIKRKDPVKYGIDSPHPFYEYKIKNFLTDVALGMTPSKIWTGKYYATGGIIIVKGDGDIVCYHIYNRNEFQDYLLNNTKLEQASTSRYGFGDLYREGKETLIKLNLQIRFS